MLSFNKKYLIILLLSFACSAMATDYSGRVVDQNGLPVAFATVYMQDNPVCGTATGNQGQFTLSSDADPSSLVVVSFIGYEKFELPLSAISAQQPITLVEQPIALQETVIAAKASKQKNKRKQMAQLLYKVYNRMQYDFADTPTRYNVVSDVRMLSDNTPWGMEQMIASVVNIPGAGREGHDSVQFCGEYCKRFFQQTIRDRADSILQDDWLQKDMRKMATEMDSGVIVHEGLWAMGNIKYDFEEAMNDIRHWTVSNESETETVLTHIEKKNYIGIFKYEYRRHYIVDSETYRVRRFSEELTLSVNIPFGYKLKSSDLELLNLLNLGEKQIEKFRLRKANATITLNTLYKMQGGHLFVLEKNLQSNALLVGTKDMEIPLDIQATQRVTSIQPDAQPMSKSAQKRRVKREIVPIY